MTHNASKHLMGTTKSSIKEVSNHNGTVLAGTAVRQKSDGTLSTTSSDGVLIGVSLGKDLSDIGRTSVCRKGLWVPIKLTSGLNPTVGAQVSISNSTGLAAASSATAVNAFYETGRIEDGGLAEDGTTLDDIAFISFPGGL
jgi:hypothetical protein